MLSPLETQCFAILTAAASATFGLSVRTNNAAKARAMLYRVRKETGDSAFLPLHIRVSPNDSEHELWVLKRESMPALSPLELI